MNTNVVEASMKMLFWRCMVAGAGPSREAVGLGMSQSPTDIEYNTNVEYKYAIQYQQNTISTSQYKPMNCNGAKLGMSQRPTDIEYNTSVVEHNTKDTLRYQR